MGAESLLLGLVVDGQHAGDALAHELDLGELGGGTTGDLGHAKLKLENGRASEQKATWGGRKEGRKETATQTAAEKNNNT